MSRLNDKSIKVKVCVLDIALLAWEEKTLRTAALYNLGSGSWLAWANGTCGAIRSTTDIPPPQSATLGLHPVARRLVLINQPRGDGTLSWRWYTAATGRSRTRDREQVWHCTTRPPCTILGHLWPHTMTVQCLQSDLSDTRVDLIWPDRVFVGDQVIDLLVGPVEL